MTTPSAKKRVRKTTTSGTQWTPAMFRAAGKVRLSLWWTVEAHTLMNDLRRRRGESVPDVLTAALKALFEADCMASDVADEAEE